MTTGTETAPFRRAIAIEDLGDGRFGAELGQHWTVGPKAHGGLLLVLLTRAGLARLAVDAPGAAPDPLVIAADFLRAPDPGPVEMMTEVLKLGRTVSVVQVRMTQGGKAMLAATVTGGVLPVEEPQYAELPEMAAEPPADAFDPGSAQTVFGLSTSCDLRFDESSTAFMRREVAPPVVRGWTRPRDEPTDVLYALMAGDILPPTVFNVGGRFGWAPTVQLTALLRARPAPGWLRVESRSRTVAGTWFDEDATVVDAAGRLVCQARQLALAPLQR
ncbi:thioesterase family protein [Pseudonocardia abyssalis]|jgi:acyl-coenzyme A thioesterase PaaI-like protein|uniref:Thioesterase family protein n=1 Tax=Pseudonocardia abyssalis TaxID=2792008 RepID=A0ABS6V0V2_9PSEU|nr:thioesterase family protein [Pseudonocardia abyssalis]MBW0117695.1 thioesterase family protein [Pseudonocardia abyssalis]MBW0137861.1 thioesterase family protein [Pseudonocardia abyssalis]